MAEEEVPTVRLNERGGTVLPPLVSQTRPRRLISPSGHVEYEPLPLFSRLMRLSEEELEEFLPPPSSYGWDDNTLNAMAWAYNYDKMTIFLPSPRYGWLPLWFPTTDLEGNEITETAQVDRFLFLLGHAIEISEDHKTMDPRVLAAGLFELHDAYEDGAFWDWDEGNEWPRANKGV